MKEIFDQLAALGIPYIKYEHPPVYTCEEAEVYYKGVPGGVSKNLFLRNKKGQRHYLVVVESHKTVDLNKLDGIIGDHKLGFASSERLQKYLKVKPGSVSPFGLIFDTENHVKVFVDEDLLKHEQVHYHPNDNTQTLLIASADLIKYIEGAGNECQVVAIPV